MSDEFQVILDLSPAAQVQLDRHSIDLARELQPNFPHCGYASAIKLTRLPHLVGKMSQLFSQQLLPSSDGSRLL